MRVLITGSSGFSGTHMAKLLKQMPDVNLFVCDRKSCDLANRDDVKNLLSEVRPDQIYHLSGSNSNDYEIDYNNNVVATKNIFDVIIECKLKVRVLLVGSAAEYGKIKACDNPVREVHELKPASFYGLTKVFQSHMMGFYHEVYGLDVVMARTFNLLGKGLKNSLFVGRLYEEIEKYKKGEISKIILGNLQNKRDYIKIEDAVKAYEKIMNRGETGNIYNVGSAKSKSMKSLLLEILEGAGLDFDCIEEKPASHINKLDIPEICADIGKLGTLIN